MKKKTLLIKKEIKAKLVPFSFESFNCYETFLKKKSYIILFLFYRAILENEIKRRINR